MISKDYNHSSVVMYSVGNEITELGLADGQEQARIMTDSAIPKIIQDLSQPGSI